MAPRQRPTKAEPGNEPVSGRTDAADAPGGSPRTGPELGSGGGDEAAAPAPETAGGEPPVTPVEAEARATVASAEPAAVAAALAAAGASTAPLPRRAWFSDLPDRGLFILFLVGGTAAVLALKLALPEAQLATWLATAAACATLFGYAGFAARLRLPGDRLGDNCYYLGFLLTLASMAAALIQFDLSGGERGVVLERLIGSFGIALFSTFLGIALRVVFLQIRRELDDLEEVTRRELQERAAELKGQLLQAVQDLEGFRLRTRQVLDERLMAVTDQVSEHLRAQAEETLALARQLAEAGNRALGVHVEQAMRLEASIRGQTEAAAALAERLGRVEVPPDLFRRELAALAERLAASVVPLEQAAQALAARLAALEVPADLVASRLEPFAAGVARAAAAVERLGAAEASRLDNLADAMERVLRRIEAMERGRRWQRCAGGWLARWFGRRGQER